MSGTDAPREGDALAFLATGEVPGAPEADEDARVAYVRACLAHDAFKAKAWPHLACFVDASNVARRRQVDVWKVNDAKASLADLDAVVTALRKLRYLPIVVSDANLFHLIDQPYEFQRKYTSYPHSVATRRQADSILLQALRKLPEAACVTNDRFGKPAEVRDHADVLARTSFYRHRWEVDAPRFETQDGAPMPGALRRMARAIALRTRGDARAWAAPEATD